MMRLLLGILLACAPAWGALGSCPLVSTMTGYEVGFSATLPAAVVDTDYVNTTAILSTANADADMELLEDALASIATDSNPEYRVKITDTAGTLINFAQVHVGIGGAAKLVVGMRMGVTAADGGRVCIYVDTDKSLSADLSECTVASAAGGFLGWVAVYFGGSTVNWADCGNNALSAVNTPVAGTNGPLGLSWTYASADSDAHTAGATGASGEMAYTAYTAVIAGNAVYATGDKVTGAAAGSPFYSVAASRGPTSTAGGPTFRWQSFNPNTNGEVQPPGGATGVSYRDVSAATDFAIGFTHNNSSPYQRTYRWDTAGVYSTFGFAGVTQVPTTNINLGRDAASSSAYWDGDLYFYGLRSGTTYEDTGIMHLFLDLLTDQSIWQIEAISEATVFGPTPAIIFWINNRTPANSSGLCGGGEAAVGEGCVGYDYGLDVLLGAGR